MTVGIFVGFIAPILIDKAIEGGEAIAKETAGDPKAARANAVVQARRIVKHGRKDPAYDPESDPAFLEAIKDFPDIKQQILVDEKDLISRGRRKDIEDEYKRELAAWEAQEGDKGEAPKQPLVVRLAIGGSGDAAWRTHCNIEGAMSDEDLAKTKTLTGKAKTVYYTGTKEYDWNFAGPGGPGTSGDGWFGTGGGKRDVGSNSIENIVNNASQVVAEAVLDAQAAKEQPIVILIKGHSRGGVAAGHVANRLKELLPQAKVELTQVDPVPGPNQPQHNQEVNVGTIDESTVVYGVYSGHAIVSFTPQQVFGAKRIIISQQAHGVGIQNGFKLGGRLYRGNALNSLPAGVYVDQNPDISVAGELELVGSADKIRSAFIDVYTRRYAPTDPTDQPGRSGKNWDDQRMERIKGSLDAYAKALPTEVFNDVLKESMENLHDGKVS